MKRWLILTTLLCILTGQAEVNRLTIWYDQPASNWEKEALPIGNGRMGAMFFGGVSEDRLALNETSLWSGGSNPSDGYSYGPRSKDNEFGSYQPFGDFTVSYNHTLESAKNYKRSLDLNTAIGQVSYEVNGIKFEREYFVSYPDQVLVMHCRSSKPGAIHAKFKLSGHKDHNAKHTVGANQLALFGEMDNGLGFDGRATILHKNGKMTANGDGISLTQADEFTVLIFMATDYEMNYQAKWKGESAQARNQKTIDKLGRPNLVKLKRRHVSNYQSLFKRVQLDLGSSSAELRNLPNNERIARYKQQGNDPELELQLFQFGRYCLISSSRPGSLPVNLQGIWNNSTRPPWASDFHSNINMQMCYWLAEPANLAECAKPLMDYFAAMSEPFAKATQRKFGEHVRGWTVGISHNPYGGQGWKWNTLGSAWYARHIWEHFLYSNDREFLKNTGYPMMKDICYWVEDYLKELGPDGEGFRSDDKNINRAELKGLPAGTLVAPHGWSHEWGPHEDGIIHDQQLVWDLFNNTIQAAKVLKVDEEWINTLAEKRDRLAGNKIAPGGYLQEWMIDRPNMTTGHRHTSHLYAVYPGYQISMQRTPELAKAAMKSLELRGTNGDSRRSWTWPWRTALWARFNQGDKAHEMVSGLIKHNLMTNMLATHPPFQMDGTYGITAGICEMLVQSHTGVIHLQPAPTKAWPKGSVKGLRTVGDVIVDYQWEGNQITNFRLSAKKPHPVKVYVNGKIKTVMPEKIARR